jgi:Arc/MetJ-type ribon-helix-helix transcriptional regulator
MATTKEAIGSKPIHMLYENELLAEIEDYRYKNRFPSRAEAIKALVRRGLDSEKKKAAK